MKNKNEMEWPQLLSHKRFEDTTSAEPAEIRSRFEQDYDRIVFCHPFRTLQDKTQVFPLPEDDFIHTRLTHSLEVSCVGRSLGKNAGAFLLRKYPELESRFSIYDFGEIVGTACLAHDLGNPPFGHSGENSISSFFRTNKNGLFFKDKVSKKEWEDFTCFEGNAQGFRILNEKNSGLKLTFSTLGAFTKYPLSSSCEKDEKRKSQQKYGYYQCNAEFFEELATEMGLIKLNEGKWCRHPLAFLVEAADDICYHIIDLEDGCRLGLVPFDVAERLLAAIMGDSFSEKKLTKIPSLNGKLGMLRAVSIGALVDECSVVFEKYEKEMLQGTFDTDLTRLIPSAPVMSEIMDLSMDKIYQSKVVLERVAGGYEIIDSLVEAFATSAYYYHIGESSNKHQSIVKLFPEEYRVRLEGIKTISKVLHVVIDFISGLTDSHAVRLYKIIKGYQLPV